MAIELDMLEEFALLRINRPQALNALSFALIRDINQAIDAAAASKARALIVTGAGDKAFCAGNDLKYHAELQAKTGKRPVHPLKGFGGLANRFDLDKPVIAAVNGLAMGGGFEIALACDIIIASDQAKFALPEPRVGLAAGAGGMQRLSRMIPLKKAMGMMLTGLAAGFVERLPHEDLFGSRDQGDGQAHAGQHATWVSPGGGALRDHAETLHAVGAR